MMHGRRRRIRLDLIRSSDCDHQTGAHGRIFGTWWSDCARECLLGVIRSGPFWGKQPALASEIRALGRHKFYLIRPGRRTSQRHTPRRTFSAIPPWLSQKGAVQFCGLSRASPYLELRTDCAIAIRAMLRKRLGQPRSLFTLVQGPMFRLTHVCRNYGMVWSGLVWSGLGVSQRGRARFFSSNNKPESNPHALPTYYGTPVCVSAQMGPSLLGASSSSHCTIKQRSTSVNQGPQRPSTCHVIVMEYHWGCGPFPLS